MFLGTDLLEIVRGALPIEIAKFLKYIQGTNSSPS